MLRASGGQGGVVALDEQVKGRKARLLAALGTEAGTAWLGAPRHKKVGDRLGMALEVMC